MTHAYSRPIILLNALPAYVAAAKKIGFDQIFVIWHHMNETYAWQKVFALLREQVPLFDVLDFNAAGILEDRLQAILSVWPDAPMLHVGPDELIDRYLEVAERFEKLLNPLSSYAPFRDKSLMRDLLAKHQDSAVAHLRVSQLGDLGQALQAFAGPSILKPAISSGSRNILAITDAASAECALQYWQDKTHAGEWQELVLEEELTGTQYSVEGLSLEGRHHFIGITEKFPVRAPNFVEAGGFFPANLSEASRNLVFECVKVFLDATGYQCGFTHTEVFVTSRGPRIVESQARLGGLIPMLVEASTGKSMEEALLRYVADGSAVEEFVSTKVAFLGIFAFEMGQTLEVVTGIEATKSLPFVEMANIWAKPGVPLVRPKTNAERHGYAVVTGATFREAEQNFALAAASLNPIYRSHHAM